MSVNIEKTSLADGGTVTIKHGSEANHSYVTSTSGTITVSHSDDGGSTYGELGNVLQGSRFPIGLLLLRGDIIKITNGTGVFNERS